MMFDPQTFFVYLIGVLLLFCAFLLLLAAVRQQSQTVNRVMAPVLFEAMPGPVQLDLIGSVAQYQRFSPEADTLYASVLHLRRKGHTVSRRGEQSHVIDGRQVSHGELIRLARGGG